MWIQAPPRENICETDLTDTPLVWAISHCGVIVGRIESEFDEELWIS